MNLTPHKTRIGVLDYGSGNLHSVCRAVAAVGADVLLSADARELERCEGLVVPGVGAFAACMAGLNSVNGASLIRRWLADDRAVLGICVGHQVMFEAGLEHGVRTAGVGVLPGVVEQLPTTRLPHMGWNIVNAAPGSVLFEGLEDQRFYFVHSYAVLTAAAHATPPRWKTSLSRHEQTSFLAAVEFGSLATVQFHPEKSGRTGALLLANWLTRTVLGGVRAVS